MELATVLSDALSAVDQANIPDDLRPIAFGKAIDILIGSAVLPTVSARPIVPLAQSGNETDGSSPVDRLQQLANTLKLDVEIVGEVYHFVGDDVQITVATSQLSSRKAAGTKEIALLLTAARQGSQIEESTSAEEIKKAAQHFGKLDASNFASALTDSADVFQILGTSRQRSVKLKRRGWEIATELVNRLGGGES